MKWKFLFPLKSGVTCWQCECYKVSQEVASKVPLPLMKRGCYLSPDLLCQFRTHHCWNTLGCLLRHLTQKSNFTLHLIYHQQKQKIAVLKRNYQKFPSNSQWYYFFIFKIHGTWGVISSPVEECIRTTLQENSHKNTLFSDSVILLFRALSQGNTQRHVKIYVKWCCSQTFITGERRQTANNLKKPNHHVPNI